MNSGVLAANPTEGETPTPLQPARYQLPKRDVGSQGGPFHSKAITGWDLTTGCNRDHLREAWAEVCAIHHWHTCKHMAAWLGHSCNFGSLCPLRHPCSLECLSCDQLQLSVAQATASRRASCQPSVTHLCPYQPP